MASKVNVAVWRMALLGCHLAAGSLEWAETLVMSGVQGGCCSLAAGSPWMSSGGWLAMDAIWRLALLGCHLAAGSLEWAETLVNFFSVDAKNHSPEQPL